MFSQKNIEISSAIKTQLNTQFSFMTDLTKNMLSSLQFLAELNVQVAQAAMEDSFNNVLLLSRATSPSELIAIASSQMYPAAEKVHAYRQHLHNISLNTQVELSKMAEQQLPEASRDSKVVAEEVIKRGEQEIRKITDRQKEAFDKLAKPMKGGLPKWQ